MRRYANLVALLIFLVLPSVFAQNEQMAGFGTVTGHITDEKNQPAAGAHVRIVRLDSRSRIIQEQGMPDISSDATGRYNFTNVPAGDYLISVHPLNGLVDQYMRKMSSISSKGLFTILGVPPITGTLSLQDASGQSLRDYVILIQQNKKSLSKAIRVQESDITDIRISVAAGKGAVEGMVHSTGGILDLDRVQVLISLNNDKTVFFSKKVGLNAKGEFKIEGLVPGEYTVMVVGTSPDGSTSWRTGPVRYVNVQDSRLSTIDLPVPGEQIN